MHKYHVLKIGENTKDEDLQNVHTYCLSRENRYEEKPGTTQYIEWNLISETQKDF